MPIRIVCPLCNKTKIAYETTEDADGKPKKTKIVRPSTEFVFDNWELYAKHILKEHNDDKIRVHWAKTSMEEIKQRKVVGNVYRPRHRRTHSDGISGADTVPDSFPQVS